MRSPYQSFDSFTVGDTVVFDRSFRSDEFDAFSELSGDRNPLHHDDEHAAITSFGKPIVPLHMTLAPLSMVAGMVFPGEPSLYLSHEVRASRPVYFGDCLRYSARIAAINSVHRILTIRVLALRGRDVVLDAVMRVQAQAASWATPPALPVRPADAPVRALITGASGEIGGAIACLLAQQGWHLLLQDRGEDERRRRLDERLRRLQPPPGKDVAFVSADLAEATGQHTLAAAAMDFDDLALVVHVASPPLTAALEDLVAVNYAALKRVTEAVLPTLLARQGGMIVGLGSVATERTIPGWEDYSASKAMAAQYIASVNRVCVTYGVRGIVVMPGLVATPYSQAHRGDLPALLPQELAEEVVKAVQSPDGGSTAIVIETTGVRHGELGFHDRPARSVAPPAEAEARVGSALLGAPREATVQPEDDAAERVADIVRNKLKLAPGFDLASAAMGTTPGWDSLRHIELVLELEESLGVRFASHEIEGMQTFGQVEQICLERLRD